MTGKRHIVGTGLGGRGLDQPRAAARRMTSDKAGLQVIGFNKISHEIGLPGIGVWQQESGLL
jgi:hypothetical protein